MQLKLNSYSKTLLNQVTIHLEMLQKWRGNHLEETRLKQVINHGKTPPKWKRSHIEVEMSQKWKRCLIEVYKITDLQTNYLQVNNH